MTRRELTLVTSVTAAVMTAAVLVYLPVKTAGVEFNVERGRSLVGIAADLRNAGLIRSKAVFIGWAVFTGREKKIEAGRYSIPANPSAAKLVSVFSGGAESDDIEVTIPEGTNAGDLVKIFDHNGLKGLRVSEFLPLEGYLFPDTYRFDKGAIIDVIIARMRENFDEKTGEVQKNLKSLKFKEAVIIASILEKEAGGPGDAGLIAGIIQKRLALGMPLEIDAAVAYGACLPKWLNGQTCDVAQVNLVDNIKGDSAYNTYKRVGLPPGPISNPGLETIKAALNPQASEYLYYLHTPDGRTGDSQTIFSKTAAEHAKNRRKYLGL